MEYETILKLFSLVYIIIMMTIDFWIFGLILRREYVRVKGLLIILSIVLMMGLESLALAQLNVLLFISGMLLVLIPLFISFLIKDHSINVNRNWKYGLLLSSVIVFDELAMGYLYGNYFSPLPNPLLTAVNNPAYGAMMLGDAIFFLYILRRRSIMEFAITTFAISMAFMPSLYLMDRMLEFIMSILTSLFMIVNIVLLYLTEMRMLTFQGQLVAISLSLFNLLMMLGLTFFASLSNLYFLTLSMIASMVWYFFLIFYNVPAKKISPKPFLFIVLVNLTELAMGFGESVLGFNLTNSLFVNTMNCKMMMGSYMMRSPFNNPFWWLFPINPLTMITMTIMKYNLLGKLVMVPFMTIMTTTMAPFYVIMMGTEMSYLVYERFKKVKTRYLKAWTLGILAGIPIFVVLIPYYTNYYIFGMSGMIFPVTLAPFVISLVVIALFSTLFGRGVYCNLVCMSAHMWSNVFYEQFSAKKNSKFWDYLRWIFLVPTIVAFYLFVMMGLGKIRLPINPLDFYGMFTLNYIWWFFYFLTPIFGIYSCARQGWCGFGTFTGIFNKVLFKIRAKDVNTCKECVSKECDTSCPIKIPISNDILKKGYSNRISCIGCARCVDACDNVEIVDVVTILKNRESKSF
ncbi:4Fe-4S binding protein [Saccharolobus islandicus]|uniref:Polyferredoxin n=1 Tax=Saccharolobus islandicus LAL14/1 TaxID=1241935 RepID=M9U7A9_SACIS|nr:polyferredoxin [Sulfolobus islandicus]AGJ62022.1 Polyferredoxin [Sulfolobus islandicus LAL14/1]